MGKHKKWALEDKVKTVKEFKQEWLYSLEKITRTKASAEVKKYVQ